MKKEITFSILLVALLLVVILIERKVEINKVEKFGAPKIEKIAPSEMSITSSDFVESGYIPSRYTCDGEQVNPTLEFNAVPLDARALVLIVEDIDASKITQPDGILDHWVVYDIPAYTEKVLPGEKLDGVYGKNSKGDLSYAPPCPSDKEHRYFFRLYALDGKIDLPEGATKKEIQEAMQGHILRQATLIGLYSRTAASTSEIETGSVQ